jgi:hypothetical protein
MSYLTKSFHRVRIKKLARVSTQAFLFLVSFSSQFFTKRSFTLVWVRELG